MYQFCICGVQLSKAKVICPLDSKCQLGSISACFVTLLDLQGVVMAAF